jgi:hypothetical protein
MPFKLVSCALTVLPITACLLHQVRKLGSDGAMESELQLPAPPSIMVFQKVDEVARAEDDVYCLPRVGCR